MNPSPDPTRALRLPLPGGEQLAVEVTEGTGPTLVWLCGYASDMNGNKASYIKQQCETWGYRLIRFDFRGTGASDGDFKTQTITRHVEDARAVVEQLGGGKPVILLGSSMGGWVGLRLCNLIPGKIAGFIGIAAAPDFTMYYEEKDVVERDDGRPTFYGPLLRDGKNNYVLDNHIEPWCGPAAFVQGWLDKSVPWKTPFKIAKKMTNADDVTVHVVKDAGHSLSRPQDLSLIWQAVTTVREKVIAATNAG